MGQGDLAVRLGVYVITPEGGDHLAIVDAACAGGAGAVQVRAPELDGDALRDLVDQSVARCRHAGVLCLVNDDLEVAADAGADGVHLGQSDRRRWGERWADVRARAGGLLLGVSVDDVAQAAEVTEAGADYLGVTVHPTATKHDARPVGLEALHAIRATTRLPLVAVGGLGVDNVAEALAAGADGVAVISAVAAAPDPQAAVEALVRAVGLRRG